jgi:hypothetical protein
LTKNKRSILKKKSNVQIQTSKINDFSEGVSSKQNDEEASSMSAKTHSSRNVPSTAIFDNPSIMSSNQNRNNEIFIGCNSLVIIKFDGASRGNPGKGGAGAVIYAFGNEYAFVEDDISPWTHPKWIESISLPSSNNTNHIAEYEGLILGLSKLHEMKSSIGKGCHLRIRGDSQSV